MSHMIALRSLDAVTTNLPFLLSATLLTASVCPLGRIGVNLGPSAVASAGSARPPPMSSDQHTQAVKFRMAGASIKRRARNPPGNVIRAGFDSSWPQASTLVGIRGIVPAPRGVHYRNVAQRFAGMRQEAFEHLCRELFGKDD